MDTALLTNDNGHTKGKLRKAGKVEIPEALPGNSVIRVANTKESYLTKRILLRAATRGLKAAAAATMQQQGYNVIAENGWVVKIFADGHTEKVKKIVTVDRPAIIMLK